MNSSVAITIYEDKVVLILRDDKPTIPNPNTWSLPGGNKDDPNESDLDTMLREFEEELGIVPATHSFLTRLKRKTGYSALYLVNLSKDEAESLVLGDEGQRFGFFKAEELYDIPLTAAIKNNLDEFMELLEKFAIKLE